jgi:hypothetical protein
MAEITVTNRNEASGMGNLSVVTAKCASLATGSTWNTKLSAVHQVFVSGEAAAQDHTWTASGGIITFTVTSGPLVDVSLMAVGLP